jgi:hypothetical protein
VTGRRLALVVATDRYDDASLSRLRSAAADADALSEVLSDPAVGGFEVDVVRDAASWEVQAHIEGLLADSRSDDLVLIHFSGHGLKSDSGELFIAARNTRPDLLASTSVPADFVQRCVRSSRAGSIVLFLDCCYGGAFGEGVAVRAAGPVNVHDSLPAERLGGGRGRAVITASSAIEYAFEGSVLTADHEIPPSVFTSAVVHGLRTGDADRDEDGLVSLDELYDYVYDRVQEENPRQTPGRDIEMSGELYLARSGRRRVRPAPVPEALAAALAKANPVFRRGAVAELRDRLAHTDLAVALGALEALQGVVTNDIRAVAQDAEAAIAEARPSVHPTKLDFGEVAPDASVAVERTLVLGGTPLARYVRTSADPPLAALVSGDTVTVTFSPTGAPFSGSLTVTSPAGSVFVPVIASLAPGGAAAPPPPVGGLASAEPEPSGATQPSEPSTAATERREVAGARPVEEAVGEAVAAPRTSGTTASSPSGASLWWAAALVAAGLLVALGGLLPWLESDELGSATNDALVAFGLRGLLLAVVGLMLGAASVSRPVALGALLGATVTAVVGLLSYVSIWFNGDDTPPGSGWWLGVAGSLLASVVGVLHVAQRRLRAPLRVSRIAWRDPTVGIALAVALVTLVLCIALGNYIESASGETFWNGATVLWGASVLGTTGFVISLAPVAAGRAVLCTVGVGLLSQSLATAMVIADNGGETVNAALVVFAAVALVGAGSVLGRGRAPASG